MTTPHRTSPNCLELRESDARDALDALRLAARRCLDDIRERLVELAAEIGASEKEAAYAMANYAENLMADFVFDRETELLNSITDLEDRLGDGA